MAYRNDCLICALFQALDFILGRLVSQAYGSDIPAGTADDPLYGTSTPFVPAMSTERQVTELASAKTVIRTADIDVRILSQLSPSCENCIAE